MWENVERRVWGVLGECGGCRVSVEGLGIGVGEV